VVEAGLFVVGGLFGLLWFSVIILPLFYGFPLTLYWAVRGWVRWRAAALYLIPPVIWSVIFFLAALVVTLFFPKAGSYRRCSAGIWLGQNFFIVLSIARGLFSKNTRLDMRKAFLHFVLRQLTPVGTAAIGRMHGLPRGADAP